MAVRVVKGHPKRNRGSMAYRSVRLLGVNFSCGHEEAGRRLGGRHEEAGRKPNGCSTELACVEVTDRKVA